MRSCDTAIIHVSAGAAAADADRQPQISDDVLIEIGAAMALYGREFVLLVEDAIELPPSLRGLREWRYSGDASKMPGMMQLLRASAASRSGLRNGRPPPLTSDTRPRPNTEPVRVAVGARTKWR